MFKSKVRFVVVSAVILLLSQQVGMFGAETWRLEEGRDWKPLSAQSQDDRYLLAVAQAKKLAGAGQCKAAEEALKRLEKDYPEIVGPDANNLKVFNAFIKAEMLFCEGKYAKAKTSYDKFLDEYYHESELYKAALDRQFHIGTAFLAGQKKQVLKVFKVKGYADGVEIMKGISNRVSLGDPIGMKAAKAVAESYERRGKFNKAYREWLNIWEAGQIDSDVLLGMARCAHASYSGPKHDASNLISAERYYEDFKKIYAEDSKELDIDKILEQINEQWAYKQFCIGRYYQRTGNKLSANLYYNMVIDSWPGTTAAKMAKQMKDGMNLRREKVKK